MRRASDDAIGSPRRNLSINCDGHSGLLLDGSQLFPAPGLEPLPRELDHRNKDITVDWIVGAVIIDDRFVIAINGINRWTGPSVGGCVVVVPQAKSEVRRTADVCPVSCA